jgi:tyrosyl-tRNA synthetase
MQGMNFDEQFKISEAKRLIQQGAVRRNGEKLTSTDEMEVTDNDVIRAGERRFARIRLD